MAGNSVSKIAVGTPGVTGGIMVAPAGTALPVGVTAPTTDFTRLGRVGDDGLRPSGERTSTDFFDWNGDLIYTAQDTHSTQFQFKLLAVYDGDVLSQVFGADNVTTVGSLTTIEETGTPLVPHAWVFDMRDKGKRLRITVPLGQVTAAPEDPIAKGGLMAFDITLNCFADENGVKAYRYYDDGTAPSAPTITGRTPSGSLAIAGGDIVYLTGTNFSGATAVTVGGTAATGFLVVDDQHLIITTPAKTAGSHNVIVTNASGPSAGFAVTFA